MGLTTNDAAKDEQGYNWRPSAKARRESEVKEQMRKWTEKKLNIFWSLIY